MSPQRGARSHRRSPRTMDTALASLRDRIAPQTLLAEVQRAWPGVVGTAIAAEAAASAERGGVLTVTCSAAVWAQELDLMAPAILGRLNTQLTGGQLTRLRCVST